jgi:hypothetical protein
VFRKLKENLRRRLEVHLQREMAGATRDVELSRQLRATQQSAEYVDRHMQMSRSYPDRPSLLQIALQQVEISGLYCEFGVYQGETLNFIASKVKDEVHGFDSFEGLPEDWKQGHETGKFAMSSLPSVLPNVRLHKGWFDQTLPAFCAENPGPAAFLHIDADLYSSTRTIFENLGNAIVPGTVIAFDEFFNYPGWEQGECKAFEEFCSARHAKVQYLGFVRRGEQIAVKIKEITPRG